MTFLLLLLAIASYGQKLPSSASFQTPLADLYVATTGSDSNPGTASSPFLTLAHAKGLLPATLDKSYTIHVADGTYAEGICMAVFSSPGTYSITVLGDVAAMDNVKFSGTCAYPAIRNDAAGTSSIFIAGPVNVNLEGLETTGAVTIGALIWDTSNVTFEDVDIESTGNQLGVRVEDGASLGLLDANTINVTTLGSTLFSTVGLDVLFSSRCWFVGLAGSPTIMIEASTSGTVSTSPFVGIHVAYNSQMAESFATTTKVLLAVENAYYGLQVGLTSSYQMGVTTPSGSKTLFLNSAVMSNKTDGSRGIQVTDNSTISVNGNSDLQIQGFQFGTDANSLSYAEFAGAGSLSRFFITTNTTTSTGGVTSGL